MRLSTRGDNRQQLQGIPQQALSQVHIQNICKMSSAIFTSQVPSQILCTSGKKRALLSRNQPYSQWGDSRNVNSAMHRDIFIICIPESQECLLAENSIVEMLHNLTLTPRLLSSYHRYVEHFPSFSALTQPGIPKQSVFRLSKKESRDYAKTSKPKDLNNSLLV